MLFRRCCIASVAGALCEDDFAPRLAYATGGVEQGAMRCVHNDCGVSAALNSLEKWLRLVCSAGARGRPAAPDAGAAVPATSGWRGSGANAVD